MRWHLAATALFLLLSTACRPPPSPPVDAGTPPVPDAGLLPPLTLDLEVALPDGGIERHALLALETPVVTPATSLTVTSNRRLRNARIRLMDEGDRALSSDDVLDEEPAGLRYHITLLSPLEPGHTYALRVDPQSGATLDDGAGHELPDQRLEFRTSGERQRPKPPTATSHRRRRRE